jgi:serine/threonine protein kinase
MTTHLVGEKFGDYRLIRLIGRGGFADVYLGEHYRRKTLAAVKVLNTRLANNNVKSFLNEARSIRLRHSNIAQILDFGLEDDFPFLVMEYAPYGSLRQRYPKGTQLKLGTICIYVRQIAAALQYAHNEGVVHRDIKADNMLIGRQKELLLSDFGIASIAHTTHSISREDQAGTINYMAPEQLQGRPRPASDQYALGIVVYEWICGTRPFQGSFAEIYSQHLMTPPPSLRKHVPTLSISVEKVVMTALAKDPHRRFRSISAFASAFEHACRSSAPNLQDHRFLHPARPSNLRKRAFLDVPTNTFQKNTKKKIIEERPTVLKLGFQLGEIRKAFAFLTKVADVLKRAMVSLPEARSKNNALKILSGKVDYKAWVSTLHKRVKVWSFAFLFMIVSLLLVGLLLAGV